jgi:hypothetical protein
MYTKLQEFLPVLLLSKLGPANKAVQHTLTLLLNKPCTQHTTAHIVWVSGCSQHMRCWQQADTQPHDFAMLQAQHNGCL